MQDIVLSDQKLKVFEIEEAIGILPDSKVSILNDNLANRMLAARYVPRLLTVDHKYDRVKNS